MEPGPDPRSSIVSAETPAYLPPEEVTEEWPAVTDLAGGEDDTDPYGFPPGEVQAAVDPWAAEAYDTEQSAYTAEESGWEVSQEPVETYATHAEPGWADAYVGASAEWAAPRDAADVSYGDGDPGWDASPATASAPPAGAGAPEWSDAPAGHTEAEWADAPAGDGAPEWSDAPAGHAGTEWADAPAGDAAPEWADASAGGGAPEWADASAGHAEQGWSDAYVGDEWAAPHDTAVPPAGSADAEWAVPQDGARAAFVGADPGWDTEGGDPGRDGSHEEPAMAAAGAGPGWPAPRDAGKGGTRYRSKPPRRKIGLALLVVALLGAGAIVTAGFLDSPADRSTAAAARPGGSPQQGRGGGTGTLTAPLDGLDNAVFDLADSATSVRLHAADLGDDLYRISSPAGSGLLPRVVRSGAEVRLFLAPSAQPGTGVVDVAVNATVGWTLRLDAGVAESVLDMAAGKVDGVELSGGASRIELILPRLQGQLAVRMTGGVDQFLVKLVKLTPVRVRADSGAGEVTVGGSTYHGIARGRSFTANGWGDGTPGVDLQAVAGMSALTVTEN